jgi:hypothetical protein
MNTSVNVTGCQVHAYLIAQKGTHHFQVKIIQSFLDTTTSVCDFAVYATF